MLNLDGRVIGINTAIVAAGQGIGFSIPINEAKAVMGQLIARGKVTRGWLGIVIQDLNDELAASFGVREREGVLVADVMKGGPGRGGGAAAGRRHRRARRHARSARCPTCSGAWPTWLPARRCPSASSAIRRRSS